MSRRRRAFQAGARAVAGWLLRRSGVTPWDAGYSGIRAREANAALCRTAPHAGQDRLERSAAVATCRQIASDLRGAFPRIAVGFVGSRTAPRDRGAAALGRKWRRLGPLAGRVLAAFPAGKPRQAAPVADFLRRDPTFQRACLDPKVRLKLRVARSAEIPPMSPAAGPPGTWNVPAITTPAVPASALRSTWAGSSGWPIARGESGPRAGGVAALSLSLAAKVIGRASVDRGSQTAAQGNSRRLLAEILSMIPAHDAAHGFCRGRSVATFVAPHAGRCIVLKMDLRDFFPSITAARVLAIFLTAGYPEQVARLLAGLCTSTVPIAVTREIEREFPTRSPQVWRSRRLSPSRISARRTDIPALANFSAYRLDARLSGLAQAALSHYTRYADDLVFSGDERFARSMNSFARQVVAIALEEGFEVQHRKTRIMRQGVRQQAAGAVLNRHLNVPRGEFDELKAILHNCAVHGPASQNRAGHHDFRAYLLGRIGHVCVLNPRKGQRLKAMFDRIAW